MGHRKLVNLGDPCGLQHVRAAAGKLGPDPCGEPIIEDDARAQHYKQYHPRPAELILSLLLDRHRLGHFGDIL
jgi:hypothetical protein